MQTAPAPPLASGTSPSLLRLPVLALQHVLVMYAGRPAEQGSRDAVLNHPRHPYTRMLLASTPFVDPARRQAALPVRGEPPSPTQPLPGCAFASRCPYVADRCRAERPTLRSVDGRLAACHFAEDLPPVGAA